MTHILTGLSLPLEWRRAPAMVTGALDFLYGLEHLRTWVRAEGSDTPRADASFRWLRDRHRRESLGSRVPFYSVYAYEPVWQPGKPELPESQLVVLDDPADRPLLEGLLARPGASGTVPAAEEGDPPYGLLIYQANLHGQLQPVGKCGRWELHSTGHAIAAYDPTGDSWSWVYVSAERIHLLLGSVLEVGCMGDVVVVEPFRAKGQREIWVVAPEIGRVGRIPVAGSDLWSFDRQRQQLRLGGGIWSIDDLHEKLANPAP